MSKKYKPIQFPKDESVHDHIIEWWYWNGHLKDKKGNEYAFMNCFFRADVRKVNIPFLNQLPVKSRYFSHSLVSDLKRREFHHHITPFSIISHDSFSKPLLYINYINPTIQKSYVNCVMEKTGESAYYIKNEDIDLRLISLKKPLLEGGEGFLDLHSKTTYYYSFTNLKTEGVIKIKNKWVEVSGKSWMDHQWADASYSPQDRWDWFSVQLDDNTDIVCFIYDDGKMKTYLADISYADGRQECHREVEIVPFGPQWKSPKTQAAYPLQWKIRIPAIGLVLTLSARIKNQEMLFGSINYWEGPVLASGALDGKKASGVGFMELVGYPSRYTNTRYMKDEIGKTAHWFMSIAKNNTAAFLDAMKQKIIK